MRNETEPDQHENAEHYIALFETVRGRVGSVEGAAAIIHEIGKDRRMAEIRADRQVTLSGFVPSEKKGDSGRGNRLASEKQLSYLKKLGVPTPFGLTADEASRAIDEAKAKQRAA